MSYNYLGQSGVASALITPRDNDSFYNPTIMNHTGFAADGKLYANGVLVEPVSYASWYTESPSNFRGSTPEFPTNCLALLSKVSLCLFDGSHRNVPMWMTFLLADDRLLTNNFNNSTTGFTPSSLTYSKGVISVLSVPDEGAIQTNLLTNIDFARDTASIDFIEKVDQVTSLLTFPVPIPDGQQAVWVWPASGAIVSGNGSIFGYGGNIFMQYQGPFSTENVLRFTSWPITEVIPAGATVETVYLVANIGPLATHMVQTGGFSHIPPGGGQIYTRLMSGDMSYLLEYNESWSIWNTLAPDGPGINGSLFWGVDNESFTVKATAMAVYYTPAAPTP